MKKKVISIILILVMLLLPFGILLNVKAADVVIIVDNNISKTGDTSSKLVSNTGTITVNNINTTTNTNDTLKAYKILDTFYNSTTNEISYDFTASFKEFKTSLDANDTYKNITVEQYMTLTGDFYEECTTYDENDPSVCISTEGRYYSFWETPSTLSVLVSKYAGYISANKDTDNAVTGITMSYDDYDSDNDVEARATVAAGAYLIIPDTIINRTGFNDGFYALYRYTYGVMVGNVYFSLDENNGDLILNSASVEAKNYQNAITSSLIKSSFTDFYTAVENAASEQELDELAQTVTQNLNFTIGNKFALMVNKYSVDVPVNTHSSITGNTTVMNRLNETTVTLPAGLTFDYTTIACPEADEPLTKTGNDYYFDETKVATAVSATVMKIYSDAFIGIDILPDPSHTFTAGASNNIVTTGYVLKDPYIDIGSNPTDNDIAKAIEEVTLTNTVTTYGIKISNVNSDNNNLTGAQFQLCSDATCNTLVGSPFTVQTVNEQTIGEFVGVSGESSAYFKQVKAATGYRIISDPIEVDFSEMTEENGYYSLEIVSQSMGLLPFTGGIGTIIYTCLGLIIVVGAITFIILYKKKNKK